MSDDFNYQMLLLARLFRGKSQAEVASMSGINQGHYSRIENGLLPDGPSPENVSKLAAALDFPTAFFFQTDEVSGLPLSVHPMHRKKASVTEKALKQIHAELNLRLIHARRYLAAVDLTSELPLPWIDVDEGGGPTEIARKMRVAWMIPPGPLGNLTELCERAGIVIQWVSLDAPVDGVAMRVRDLPPFIFLNRRVTADRMRFSLAHELGHLIMHRVPTDSIEDEAHAFAAELLVPEREISRQVIGNRVTLEFLARQKAFWKVSMAFLLFRIARLGLITRHQSDYLWKQISGLGWKLREPTDTDLAYDPPTMFPHVVQLHSTDLGYDVDALSTLLNTSRNDVRRFYGEHLGRGQPPKLFVVR